MDDIRDGLRGRDSHDFASHPNFDRLGCFYIIFAAIYSLIVLAGLIALFVVRKSHAVRIRSFKGICATVVTLQIYLVLIILAYPLNGLYKCWMEFWIMNIVLPLGIALFQAGNTRLFSYAMEQKEISQGRLGVRRRCTFNIWRPRPLEWVRHWTTEQRTYGLVLIGFAFQIFVATVVYNGSRKFHADYGFFGRYVNEGQCRLGTEWVPSVVWQFLWAAVFGPYILLRIRDINDTHYWAWQTRLAIIACLPGTPLWLTFIYSTNPHLAQINPWFVPAGWFLPGLIMMQFVSIFFPLLDVYKLKSLENEFGKNRTVSQNPSDMSIYHDKKINPYSMATLELQLDKNPSQLLYWAYTKEFTAENIIFLTSVRDLKRKWNQFAKITDQLDPVRTRELYEEAAMVFFRLVNPTTARRNINIDSRTFRELENMFRDCQYEPVDDDSSVSKSSSQGTQNVVAPWEEHELHERPRSVLSDESRLLNDQVNRLYPLPVTEIHAKCDSLQGDAATKEAIIPSNFDIAVFDRAYDIVKNDVYLNTWVRFVNRERVHDWYETLSLGSEISKKSLASSQWTVSSTTRQTKYMSEGSEGGIK